MIQDGQQSAENRDEVDSFLMMGQSNMAGRGDLGIIPDLPKPLCKMLRNGRWQPMHEPVNIDRSIFHGSFPSGVSLASFFAEEYAAAHQRKAGLIPCADGGTKLCQWMPGELLYDHAVMQARLAQRSSVIRAVLWHQGESDCTYDLDFEDYGERLAKMFASLRQDLGSPDLPILIGELSEHITPRWGTHGRNLTFNQYLPEYAKKIGNCAVVSSKGLTLRDDGIHFQTPSCREFGIRYLAAYEKLCK